MVKVSLWASMMDRQKTKTCLPLSGPGTDINVSSIHTVGYLGKFFQSTSLDPHEYCPVCAAKGKRQVLRRYGISFEESILLCANPQCFFPLGCKPLNEILTSSTLPSLQSLYSGESIYESSLLIQSSKQNVKRQKTLNCSNKGTWDSFSSLSKESAFKFTTSRWNKIDNFSPYSNNGSNHQAVNSADVHGTGITNEPIHVALGQLCGKRKEPSTESEHSGLEVPKEELSIEQFILQWKNTAALCWLDCILTALVHSKVLRNVITNLGTEVESPIKKLCTEYDQACALLSNSQCCGTADGLWKIPPQLLAQIELILNNIRERFFNLLQPKLRCELGKPDSPVFAFPLLLKQDAFIEMLFIQTYIWSFECMKCGYKYDERCTKTLTTFTKIDSDWHPLNAVHKSPCNKCQDKDQRRKMHIERISSIYMLHFMDGPPHIDLDAFGFDFEGCLYRICSIIQYLPNMKHFVTWIRNSDGSWLQCDDLQGFSCVRRSTLEVPAHEVHIIIWERSDFEKATRRNTMPHGDSSSVTGLNAPSLRSEATSSDVQPPSEITLTSTAPFSAPDKQIISAPNVDCVKENDIKGTSNNNFLTDLWHLEDDAMRTPNLVEIKLDDEGTPLDNIQFIPDCQQLQNAPLIDCNVSVHPPGEVHYSSEECQIAQTIANSDTTQKHILQFEMPFSPSRSLQLQDTDLADIPSAILQRDSTVKNRTVQCQEGMVIPSGILEITTKSDVKIQKGHCNKISTSPTAKTPAANKSPTHIPQTAVAKRNFTVGWGKNLLNRHLSILATNEPGTTSKKEVGNTQRSGLPGVTNSKSSAKAHYDGFKSKNTQLSVQMAIKNPPESPDLSTPNRTCVQNNNIQRFSNMKDNCKKISMGAHTLNKTYLSNSSKFNNSPMCETGTYNVNHQSLIPVDKTELNNMDSKAQKLRLKLLKKLQTKKNQLASLDQQMKTNQCGEYLSAGQSLNLANNNGDLMYDDFLNDLCGQSGVEDRAVCTSSNASLSSSPSHDELLAELFTPTTATTFTCMKPDDLRYGEPPTGGIANGKLSTNYSIGSGTANNNLTSPISASTMPQQAYKDEFTSITNIHTSSFESPIKDDMLVDLLSISTLNSLAGDHELPNFDENLFENC
ncbi:SUMO-specific isopeptidase USPL1 [Rhinoraja longicauda]